MYVVAGDSWGCGEWVPRDPSIVLDPPRGNYELSLIHRGLAEYLEQHDSVVNISKPGAGNFEVLQRIRLFLDINYNFVPEIKKIFVFQTSWWRDFVFDYFYCWIGNEKDLHRNFEWRLEYTGLDKNVHPLLQLHIDRVDKLEYNVTSKWYNDLSNLAKERGVEIVVIGGLSDASDYPTQENLTIGCASMVNLAIENNENPTVPSAGGYISDELVDVYTNICRLDKNHVLEYLQKFESRTKLLAERLDLFPDGHHGNRECHFKVYKLLEEKGLLGL